MDDVSVSSERRVLMMSKRLRAMFGTEVVVNTGTLERGVDSCVSWALPFNVTKDNGVAVSFFSAFYYSSFEYHIADAQDRIVKITTPVAGTSLPITGGLLAAGCVNGKPPSGVYKPGFLH